MDDGDSLRDQIKLQADNLESLGDIKNAELIRSLLNDSNSQKDEYKIDINIETTLDKFDKDMNLIETIRK